MSLILDALKKSEAERQRGEIPNLLSPLPSVSDSMVLDKASRMPWFILIAVLITAIVFAAYFYQKSQIAPSPGNEPAAIVQTPAPGIKPEPIEHGNPVVAPKPVVVEKPVELPAPAPVPSSPAVTIEQAPASPAVDETQASERIASLAEMPADQRQQLPPLKLSMHVYSPEANKRFAIIDGQRVNEGSVLGSAVVEQIRQDGVVLSMQGQSYLLPRP